MADRVAGRPSAPGPPPAGLPELAGVPWRPLADEETLRRSGRLWTVTVLAHTVPLTVAAVVLVVLAPLTIPLAVVLLVHAWVIPELYAARGAKVVRRRPGPNSNADRVAIGFLGDLVGHRARDVLERTGLVLERGTLGVWLVGEAGALLVRPGGRRVNCYCVRVPDPELPGADRVAHLLLALRADERGFATVANLAFSGACWRLARRLAGAEREALAQAVKQGRAMRPTKVSLCEQDVGRIGVRGG